MPVVKFIERLYLEQNISSMDKHKLSGSLYPGDVLLVEGNSGFSVAIKLANYFEPGEVDRVKSEISNKVC